MIKYNNNYLNKKIYHLKKNITFKNIYIDN